MLLPALTEIHAQLPASGTTVICHGYQATSSVPDWVFSMADAVAQRAGGGRVFVNNKNTGDLEPCTNPYCSSPGSGSETVIVYDWADDSNESGTGFSESAAESLFAGLIQWSRMNPAQVNLEHLHLIGHSRGTVVNSEVAERLIAAGFPAPEQLTSLDPHDGGALKKNDEEAQPEERLSWEDFDVNILHPEYRCGDPPEEPSGVCSWAGVGYCDDYWRDIDNLACNIDPDGKPIPGAAVFDASGLDDFCHSDVHSWYAFTVNTSNLVDPVTGDPPGDDWFIASNTSCTASERTDPLARTIDGYNMSRIGGGVIRCPDDQASRQDVHFDFNLREGLVNGDFDNDGSGGADISGWSFHGGGGSAEVYTWGNQYLDLFGGEWREHNRFYLPRNAWAISFCRRIFDAGSSDVFSFYLKVDGAYRNVYSEDLITTEDWSCFAIPLLWDERDRPVTIFLTLSDRFGENPNVGVDEISILTGLFFDGFESGNVEKWSATTSG